MRSVKKAAIVCCSDGMRPDFSSGLDKLCGILSEIGAEPKLSRYIFRREGVASGTARQRAEALMDFYRDSSIDDIFDISGGDIANQILPYLDYEVIARSEKLFWGYSDLTTVINAIYAKTGRPSVLYQIRNLIGECGGDQLLRFKDMPELFYFGYSFFQGSEMSGVTVGGNIRCLLKLAGTEYFPDTSGKLLFLEARGGGEPQIITYLNQLKQMGVFDRISGLLLGTFTQLDRECGSNKIISMVKEYAGENIPAARTMEIGHGSDSKAIIIGRKMTLKQI